jgi:hypothetical protein
MAPAVDPNPEPIVLLLDADELDAVGLLDDELVVVRSEKRLELPRVAPRLAAGELLAVEPEVFAEEDVLVAVFEEAIAVVEALIVVEPEDTLEAFELEFREEPLLPL